MSLFPKHIKSTLIGVCLVCTGSLAAYGDPGNPTIGIPAISNEGLGLAAPEAAVAEVGADRGAASNDAVFLMDGEAADFTFDVDGEGLPGLDPGDAGIDRGAGSVFIADTAANEAPVADAGADQSVTTGDPLTLDGGSSSDADGDPLTYRWTVTLAPPGSDTRLSDADSVNPSVTTDIDGDYVISLVVNDGTIDSLADSVTITAENHPPVADAGIDQRVTTGDTVVLSGNGSSDADGDAFTYRWMIVSAPPGSRARLSDTRSISPEFVADVDGEYVISLIVNDGAIDGAADSVLITSVAENTAPVADAGTDQSVATGATVVLDGSGSSDRDGDTLSHHWLIVSMPAGSSASLSGSNSARPQFSADVDGDYVVSLVVNDGELDSNEDSVTITIVSANRPPVADAGADRTVTTGDALTLSGAGSSDSDDDDLSYRWTISSAPGGSSASLTNAASVSPGLTTDVDGDYVIDLIVNDGSIDSGVDSVIITSAAANEAPLADAGMDRFVTTGDTVILNGGDSSDANGDDLTYRWAITFAPPGSSVSLSDANSSTARFTADVDGDYVFELIVNDGSIDSEADSVTVTSIAANAAPIADAGADQRVATGGTVILSGSGSADSDGDSLSYRWAIAAAPSGSSASLRGADSISPGFVADVDGEYVLSLIVNDGSVDSDADRVKVFSVTRNAAPVADAGANLFVTVSYVVTLDGSGSADSDGDALTYRWTFTSVPAGSRASLIDADSIRPGFIADVEGDFVLSLVVNDGTVDSRADSVTITSEPVLASDTVPVADAGADQTVTTGTVVTVSGAGSVDSEGSVLRYRWAIVSAPAGSSAALSDADGIAAEFTADVDGDYVLSLVVDDGNLASRADSVTITSVAANAAPVANAGDDRAISTGNTVSVSGAASADSDGDTLGYRWTITAAPAGSRAALSDAGSVNATFEADVDGVYVLELVVNDGSIDSGADSVTITAKTGPADFYTPAPMAAVLRMTRAVSWSELTIAPTDLTRFSMGTAGSADIFVLTDAGKRVDARLGVESGLASRTSATDDLLLRSMFQFIENTNGTFRIVSTKHSNYALDVAAAEAGDRLVLKDVRSANMDTDDAGYLEFTVATASPVILSATGRKVYDPATAGFKTDAEWIEMEVVQRNDELLLTDESGSPIGLYAPPIDFDIPFDFNPDALERTHGPQVAPVSAGDDPIDRLPDRIVDAYADQLAASGADAGTTAAAQDMLAAIDSDLAGEGAQLRYPPEFYLAFRDGLLQRVVQFSDSIDGVIGQATVPYVFFTNETDSHGDHHPFMVIASYGLPDALALLWDVARAPGDSRASGAANRAVPRSFRRAAALIKIPMRDYGEVDHLTENVMNLDLAANADLAEVDHHTYASISATGVAIDGVLIHAAYNKAIRLAQAAAELSAHGMHAGQDLVVHYHADAHSATGNGLNLYNAEDYVNRPHPPIVSIGFDGVAGYGVYQRGDRTSHGAGIELDEFGAHEHGAYGYHYHAVTQRETTPKGAARDEPPGDVEYTVHRLPPHGAWAGRINDIPEFWNGPQPNYADGKSIYLGTR